MSIKNAMLLSALLVAASGVVGCGKSADKSVAVTAAAPPVAGDAHSHEGWWCNEHGVPEEVCAQCSTKIAADFKAKGDWCKKHDRPESQCFICHPEKEAEFAAVYQAKYGTEPPKVEAENHAEEPKS